MMPLASVLGFGTSLYLIKEQLYYRRGRAYRCRRAFSWPGQGEWQRVRGRRRARVGRAAGEGRALRKLPRHPQDAARAGRSAFKHGIGLEHEVHWVRAHRSWPLFALLAQEGEEAPARQPLSEFPR